MLRYSGFILCSVGPRSSHLVRSRKLFHRVPFYSDNLLLIKHSQRLILAIWLDIYLPLKNKFAYKWFVHKLYSFLQVCKKHFRNSCRNSRHDCRILLLSEIKKEMLWTF